MKFEGTDFTLGGFLFKAITLQVPLLFSGRLNSAPRDLTTWTSARNGYIVLEAQCKMKMWGLLFKMYKKFQDCDCRTLDQARGLSKHLALCDCTSPGPSQHFC